MRKVFLFSLIGFLIGAILMVLLGGGYFVPWQQLPLPPELPVRLVSGDQLLPIIELMDGSFLVFKENKWRQLPTLHSENGYTFIVSSECDSGRPALQFTANPPRDIFECLELHEVLYETSWQLLVALDGEGKVWIWEEPNTWTYGLGSCTFPLLGVIISGFLAAIFIRRSSKELKGRANISLEQTLRDGRK